MQFKFLAVLSLTLVTFAASAVDCYVWTGAVDGRWMEPGNWMVKGSDPAASPSAADLARNDYTVEFTDVTGGHTTIDLEGLGVISNLIVRAGAPKYTFGSDSTQVFALLSRYNVNAGGGRFVIEAGAATPEVPCRFGWRNDVSAKDTSTDGWNINTSHFARFPTIVHNGTAPLVFTNAFWCSNEPNYPGQLAVAGSGTVRFDGFANGTRPTTMQFLLLSTTGGRVFWNIPGSAAVNQLAMPKSSELSGAWAVFEIGADSTVTLNGGYQNLLIGEGSKLRLEGAGNYRYSAGQRGSTKALANLMCDAYEIIDGEVEIAVNRFGTRTVKSKAIPPVYDANFCWESYDGTVTFCEPSVVSGAVKVVSSSENAKLRLPSIGLGKEVPTALGYADLHVAGNGIIDYIGVGETCDRSLTITNHFSGQVNGNWETRTPKAQLWHDGTGPLFWNGPIVAHVDADQAATLTLGGASAFDAELGVALADPTASTLALNKVGMGLWRLTADCSFTGTTTVSAGTLALGDGISYSSPVSMKGGVLQVEGEVTLASLAQTSGDATLRVTGETTLVIPTVTRAAGTLNVIPDDAATVKLPGLAGTTPSWLKWRGVAATVDANGFVTPAGVTGVAAKGDVVADDAGTVAIVRTGSGANTGLAAPEVSVGKLQQMIQTAATVEFGANETLTAGEVAITADSGDLTLGAVEGQGTLTGVAGLLTLTSASPEAELTVNAAVGAVTNKLTAGSATLAGGTATTADLRVSKGTLTLTGEKTFKFDSISIGRGDQNAATIILDGAKDVQFGDGGFLLGLNDAGGDNGNVPVRMIMTNSTLTSYRGPHKWTSYADDFGTFVIGRRRNAILEVQADSLISNLLCVGVVPVNSNTDRWFTGLLRQTGGEVRPAAGRSDCGIGGRYGNATYLMEGGLLQPVGSFNIGNASQGTLDLRGGRVVYPSGITLGGSNGSHGLLRASGGTMTVATEMTLSSASLGGWGFVCIEGEADVAARSVYITLPNDNKTCVGVVALNGGLLTTSGFNVSQASTETKKALLDVGFSGGTLRTRGSYNDIFHYGSGLGTPTVTVYAGGCTIDTNEKEGNFTVEPFAAPSGKGVAGVTMPKASYTATCEPFLVIEGDGRGALAVPVWDYETLAFTGVRIVQPGCGYTWAKITAYGSSSNSRIYFSAVDCDLSDNVNTGSFTKAGEGDFVFKAANTYGGDTILKGGTLRAAVAGAIPSGSTVVFAGGTLTFGDDVTKPTAYAADYATAVKGMPTTGDYVFPSGATITVRNVPETDLLPSVDLLSLGADYEGPKPAINLSGITLPQDYEVRWIGNKLRLGQPIGMMMIVR